MSQQTQDDFYKDPAALAMDYAAALNGEIADLFAAGADIVQIDEPYMQAQPQRARAFGVEALNRALAGAKGTTAVHLCFGYAAFIKQRPERYSFLPELAQANVDQISSKPRSPNLPSTAATSCSMPAARKAQ